MENVIAGMEFEPLTVNQVRAMEDLPPAPPAESGDVLVIDPPYYTLTPADIVKALEAAVALWTPGYKRAAYTKYLIYGTLMLPIETAKNVLQYLVDELAKAKATAGEKEPA